jgi:hypothetical protein
LRIAPIRGVKPMKLRIRFALTVQRRIVVGSVRIDLR